MKKVAFLIDGNYFFMRIKDFKSFYFCGQNIREYCSRHIESHEAIYRIFYYDALPLDRDGTNPLGTHFDFSSTPSAIEMKKRLDSIRNTPQMALRLGKIAWHNDWILTEKALKDLTGGTRILADLKDADFRPNFKQKAVDMKIGLDIAALAYKKLVDRVVLIAGDADFVPAAKLARREGLQVTLDPVGAKVPEDLAEHVDWIKNALNPNYPGDVKRGKSFFVTMPKEQ